MTWRPLVLLLLLSLLPWTVADGQAAQGPVPGDDAAAACGFDDGGPATGRLMLGGRPLLYRFDPAPPMVGRPLAIDLLSCASDPPDLVGVDAVMPAHRHGMNYRPQLHAVGPGAWRAEGLLLHMPGSWRFNFGFRDASGAMAAQTLLTVR